MDRSGGSFVVREMAADDLAAVEAQYSRMYEEQKAFGMVMELNEGELGAMLQAQLKSKLYLTLVAESEGRLAGFAVGSLVRYPSKYRPLDEEMPFIGFINDVYVEPPHRGTGLAGRLVRELERQFAEQGIGYVELQVLGGNDRGRGFWSANGYGDVLQVMYKKLK